MAAIDSAQRLERQQVFRAALQLSRVAYPALQIKTFQQRNR
jgi:hypothetical protein